MSDAINIDVADAVTSADGNISPLIAPTPLTSSLLLESAGLHLSTFAGAETVARFHALEAEINALVAGCGIFDLGWRAQIIVRGEDRLRWLSGMVTNAVQQLPDGGGNYSFFLNAQGRILGDGFVYRDQDQLIIDSSVDQVAPLMAHLDHFIIMDDVTLEDAHEVWTSIGLAGPKAPRVMTEAGIVPPANDHDAPLRFAKTAVNAMEIAVLSAAEVKTPRYQIICRPKDVLELWRRLLNAGGQACGVEAVEALRILEGLPRYRVDLNDRDLPQETSQTRALNFNKGCYLGQEIVERIRSRGAVHRALHQFSLQGVMPELPAELSAADKVVGRLTSAVAIKTAGGQAMYGLAIVRSEALSRGEALTYNGGTAQVLERAPKLDF